MKNKPFRHLKVDRHGVPLLIQDVRWNKVTHAFEAALFIGFYHSFTPNDLGMHVPTDGYPEAKEPNSFQWFEAENKIEKIIKKDWKENYLLHYAPKLERLGWI